MLPIVHIDLFQNSLYKKSINVHQGEARSVSDNEQKKRIYIINHLNRFAN